MSIARFTAFAALCLAACGSNNSTSSSSGGATTSSNTTSTSSNTSTSTSGSTSTTSSTGASTSSTSSGTSNTSSSSSSSSTGTTGVSCTGPVSGTNDATFVSQNVPTNVVAGSTFQVTVVMQNSGNMAWALYPSKGYYLGTQHPQDNTTFGTNRIFMDASACVAPGSSYTFTATLTAPSTPGTYTMQWQMLQDQVQWFGATTPVVNISVNAPSLPAPPRRDQVGAVQLTFQGLSVTLPDYGTIPWFEPAITSISPSDRQLVYAAKHAAGDTHLIMALSWNYAGDQGYAYPIQGNDLSGDLPAFRALVKEAIENGFIVMVFLAGDGESNPAGGYNDPVGWTYGYSWLMQNLASIVGVLQESPDLTPYILFVPGWDGVVPGWAPDASNPSSGTYVYPAELDLYLQQARALLPNGYLGVELAAGYAHWGGSAANYTSAAGQDLDVILQEFPGPPTGDQVWQIAGRELGPAYVRPSDQPSGDDPSPPYYLQGGTPRGPFFPIAFEYDAYRWVRGDVSASDIATEKAYLLGVGYPTAD
ncbi:MAG: hypothetical protein JST54_20185 [Deltaproteobacteria bacterium]|nr:hypothetical protein [Deltaproteobacteria bacterium]